MDGQAAAMAIPNLDGKKETGVPDIISGDEQVDKRREGRRKEKNKENLEARALRAKFDGNNTNITQQKDSLDWGKSMWKGGNVMRWESLNTSVASLLH